ncbi:DUF3450 domain-containing protein [Colwellia echini]|uniref:DUF3450 domain-containing protein n=1 Tax=Colwellia echini TaxID=1982103 RepID=A0ABY3MZN1_9GAMM|nr:DUF3450 domain-containing protein [Colwellia echini]TYK66655.1 DUF3450 domain-containing protein [Colwellia echini]
MVIRNSIGVALLSSAILILPSHAVENSLEQQESINKSAAASQNKIDTLAETTLSDFQKYRLAEQRLESLTIYNQQMAKLVQSQESEITSINKQINEIDGIETGALPLMLQMTNTLSELLNADIPFLKEERKERIETLVELIDRADVSAGEKYRRIMEAYQVEMEYGRTIEAYRGIIVVDNAPRTVDFLRFGRVGLYYQTLDGNESGKWDSSTKSWKVVNDDYRTSIRDGLRIARKQMPPELLTLPVNSPAS